MCTLPTIIEEEEERERVLKKIYEFKNLSFYMTIIPEDIDDLDFVSFLKSNKIHAIVRPKEDYHNYFLTTPEGILDFIINFEDPIPDGFLINLLVARLKNCIAGEDPVSIAIEESVRGAYVLVYVLVQLGENLKEVVKEIKEVGLELEKIQIKFLRQKSRELKKFRNNSTCSIS